AAAAHAALARRAGGGGGARGAPHAARDRADGARDRRGCAGARGALLRYRGRRRLRGHGRAVARRRRCAAPPEHLAPGGIAVLSPRKDPPMTTTATTFR